MSRFDPTACRLDGKVAVITGGSRGIGLKLARTFLDAGCSLMLAARDPERLRQARAQLGADARRLETAVCDVSSADAVEAMVRSTVERFGAVDILINNAAVLGPIGPGWETPAAAWEEAFRVNLLGTYLCCRAVLPMMIRRRQGKVINVSGRGAAAAWPKFSAYGVSKTAVVRLTETLALEARPFGVQVNVMAPGANDTELFRRAADVEPAMRQDVPADPDGPGRLALFLASPVSDHITGRFIHVNQPWWRWSADDVAGDRFTLRRVESPTELTA